jgi:hypothetical protein
MQSKVKNMSRGSVLIGRDLAHMRTNQGSVN